MSFFDTGSIWESGLLFSSSKISQILDRNGPLEDLLLEDDFIQETQSQSRSLMEFLRSGHTMHRLLYYLTVPQRAENEERAFRFPYMACEALCCNVQPLTEEITSRTRTGRDHLSMLFGGLCNQPGKDGIPILQAKARKRFTTAMDIESNQLFEERRNVDGTLTRPLLKPYLAGYITKVILMLCKREPAAIVRYLDSTPHVLKGLIENIDNGAVASLLPTLFSLPFDRSVPSSASNEEAVRNGMFRLCLSRFDNPVSENIPSLLLGTISKSLDLVSEYVDHVNKRRTISSSVPHLCATASANAAEVIVSLLRLASSSTPHGKFAQDGYNSEHRFGSDASKAAMSGAGVSSSSSDDPLASFANLNFSDDPSKAGPLSLINTELDAAFHTPSSIDTPDSISLRFLKSLRDGPHAETVQKLAIRSAKHLVTLQSSSAKGRLGLAASGVVDEALGPLQTICESSFRVLSVVLDSCAKSSRQQHIFSNDQQSFSSSSSSSSSSFTSPVYPVPKIITLLSTSGPIDHSQGDERITNATTTSTFPNLSELVKFLNSLSASALETTTLISNNKNRAGVIPPSYENAPKLGSAGLAVARALGNFTRCGLWPEANTAAAKCLVFPCLLDAVQAFPWHSLLHRTVTDAIIDSLRQLTKKEGENSVNALVPNQQASVESLLFEGKLLTRIVSTLKLCGLPSTIPPLLRTTPSSASMPSSSLLSTSSRSSDFTFSSTPSSEATTPTSPPPLSRSMSTASSSTHGAAKEIVGYVGHFILLANTIVSLHEEKLLSSSSGNLVEKHSDFWSLVSRELAVANVTRGVLNGGLAPDAKASGHVGANADATGSRSVSSVIGGGDTPLPDGADNDNEEVDDEDALMHKLNRPHGDFDEDGGLNDIGVRGLLSQSSTEYDEDNNGDGIEREREERIRSLERARQIVQLAMGGSGDDDDDDDKDENNEREENQNGNDDFDFDPPPSQAGNSSSSNSGTWGGAADFSAFSAFNDEGDDEDTSSGVPKEASIPADDWALSFATSSETTTTHTTTVAAETATTTSTLSSQPPPPPSLSISSSSSSSPSNPLVVTTISSPSFLEEDDAFGQLDDEFSISNTNAATAASPAVPLVSTAPVIPASFSSVDDDVFGGGGQIEDDDPFGGSTTSFSSSSSSFPVTTTTTTIVASDDPFAF
jgi:hypothetical protein